MKNWKDKVYTVKLTGAEIEVLYDSLGMFTSFLEPSFDVSILEHHQKQESKKLYRIIDTINELADKHFYKRNG